MEDTKFECRACLDTFEAVNLYNLFQTWNQLWEGLSDNVIATDLSRLAYIQLSEMDSFSKLICKPCLLKLKEACQFTAMVKLNDTLLMQRQIDSNDPSGINSDLIWPKPMHLETSGIEVKEEILPDDEYSTEYNSINYNEGSNGNINFADVEIKNEPEEIMQPLIQLVVNGTLAEDDYQGMGSELVSDGGNAGADDNHSDPLVKSEPLSEEEQEPMSDLPLECMLCAKIFKKISGLKAHVIAQHTYKAVRRKVGDVSPQKINGEKNVCAICHRNFVTLTDLMVHETCHNKAVCYGCGQKCDTFQQLTKHRARCKALRSIAKKTVKPKTLEDVIRNQTTKKKQSRENQILQPIESQTVQANEIGSQDTKADDMKTRTDNKRNLLESVKKSETTTKFKEKKLNSQEEIENKILEIKKEYLPLFTCSLCYEEFNDHCYLKVHEEINHGSKLIVNEELKTMKTELLDSLFDDP